MRQRTWGVRRLFKKRQDDERGAELVEFAVVVVLLITLLYGIITYGLILAAQATVTQAAADGARAGMVQSTTSGQTTVAAGQAATDVNWMNKGTCETDDGLTSAANPISCVAVRIPCPSNTSAWCLQVTVTYHYSDQPLFPELPGLGVITPSTISSTNVLQIP